MTVQLVCPTCGLQWSMTWDRSDSYSLPLGVTPVSDSAFLRARMDSLFSCPSCKEERRLCEFPIPPMRAAGLEAFATPKASSIDTWAKFEQLRNGDFDLAIANELGVEDDDE